MLFRSNDVATEPHARTARRVLREIVDGSRHGGCESIGGIISVRRNAPHTGFPVGVSVFAVGAGVSAAPCGAAGAASGALAAGAGSATGASDAGAAGAVVSAGAAGFFGCAGAGFGSGRFAVSMIPFANSITWPWCTSQCRSLLMADCSGVGSDAAGAAGAASPGAGIAMTVGAGARAS